MAVLLPDHDACFIHVPKTGGCWVEAALERAGVKTEEAPQAVTVDKRHACPEHLSGRHRTCFAFVRHPVAWCESWWKYFYSEDPAVGNLPDLRVWHPQHCLVSLMDEDFGVFVDNLIEAFPKGYLTWLYRVYLGHQKFPQVQLVGRQERLADDLVAILRRLNVEFDETALRSTPRQNVSRCRLGEPVWDPLLRKEIEEQERHAIRQYYRSGQPSPVVRRTRS